MELKVDKSVTEKEKVVEAGSEWCVFKGEFYDKSRNGKKMKMCHNSP